MGRLGSTMHIVVQKNGLEWHNVLLLCPKNVHLQQTPVFAFPVGLKIQQETSPHAVIHQPASPAYQAPNVFTLRCNLNDSCPLLRGGRINGGKIK